MSILGCLTIFACLCGVLTGAVYTVEHGDQSRRAVVKKSKKSYFSRFFACYCCCGDAPTSKITVVKVVTPTKELKEINTLESNKEKTKLVKALIKQESCVIKRPSTSIASLRVLIVDGAVSNCVKLSDFCQSSGINIGNIVGVKSGKDAITAFFEGFYRDELFSIILLGENTQDGLTQIEVVGNIRRFEVERNPIIISTSGGCGNESMAAYERYSMDDVFVKPFNVSIFKALLKKYFRFTSVKKPNQNLLGTVNEELYDE